MYIPEFICGMLFVLILEGLFFYISILIANKEVGGGAKTDKKTE